MPNLEQIFQDGSRAALNRFKLSASIGGGIGAIGNAIGGGVKAIGSGIGSGAKAVGSGVGRFMRATTKPLALMGAGALGASMLHGGHDDRQLSYAPLPGSFIQ